MLSNKLSAVKAIYFKLKNDTKIISGKNCTRKNKLAQLNFWTQKKKSYLKFHWTFQKSFVNKLIFKVLKIFLTHFRFVTELKYTDKLNETERIICREGFPFCNRKIARTFDDIFCVLYLKWIYFLRNNTFKSINHWNLKFDHFPACEVWLSRNVICCVFCDIKHLLITEGAILIWTHLPHLSIENRIKYINIIA